MALVYIEIDDEGNVQTASTTNPELINYNPNDKSTPNYEYEFELTWEQIEELWKYRIVNGELVLKEEWNI